MVLSLFLQSCYTIMFICMMDNVPQKILIGLTSSCNIIFSLGQYSSIFNVSIDLWTQQISDVRLLVSKVNYLKTTRPPMLLGCLHSFCLCKIKHVQTSIYFVLGSGEVLPSLGVRRPSVVRPLTFHILIYSSETTGPNGTKLGRKHLCKNLYKTSSFSSIRPTNMATVTKNRTW
jgi:hypothetical protein